MAQLPAPVWRTRWRARPGQRACSGRPRLRRGSRPAAPCRWRRAASSAGRRPRSWTCGGGLFETPWERVRLLERDIAFPEHRRPDLSGVVHLRVRAAGKVPGAAALHWRCAGTSSRSSRSRRNRGSAGCRNTRSRRKSGWRTPSRSTSVEVVTQRDIMCSARKSPQPSLSAPHCCNPQSARRWCR